MMSKLASLTTESLHRPYTFGEVVANVSYADGTRGEIRIHGKVYSEYNSGPSLFLLADACAEIDHRVKSVGLKSCNYLGYRA